MHKAAPDADDTAKTILTLSLLDKDAVKPDEMISKFDTGLHFRTYTSERNSSFSANCNVLNALLHLAEPEAYQSQISRAANFLYDAWHVGSIRDKWVRFVGVYGTRIAC